MKASITQKGMKVRVVPARLFEGVLSRAEKAADNHMVKETK